MDIASFFNVLGNGLLGLYVDRAVFYSLLGHISDDHSEDKEADTKMLLDFCSVQRQLIQTHDSVLKLYRDEAGSTEEPWKGKSKELVSKRGKGCSKKFS